MKQHLMPITVALLACLPLTSLAEEPTEAEKAFKAYGDLMTGGVWTRTDEKGNELVHEYRWVLDKKFIQMRTVKDDNASIATIGIDPDTGKMTWWGFGFSAERGTTIATISFTEFGVDSWSAAGTVGGNKTKIVGKWKLSKLGDDKIQTEAQLTINGKQQEPRITEWNRVKK